MGNNPEQLQHKKQQAPVQDSQMPGQLKQAPAFDLKAQPLQGKFDWSSISSMLSPIADWIKGAFAGDSEGKEGGEVPKEGAPVNAPANLAAGNGAGNGGGGNAPVNNAPTGGVKEQAPAAVERGTAVTDDKIYFVSDPKSAIRKNDDPSKSAGKNLPQGISVKRVAVEGSVSQVEVVALNGLTGVAVGDKYWTSTANLTAGEAISYNTLKWVTSTQKATSAPFGKGSSASVERDTTCHCTQRVKTAKTSYVLLTSEDGKTTLGWVEEKHVLNAPKDRKDNFSWMGDAGWDASQTAVSATDLDLIKKNRTGINDRSDKNTYKHALKAQTGGGYMYSDSSRDVKLAVEGKTDIEKEINQTIYKELMSEGSWSSMNTYDGEIFTWGRGWASTGALHLVFEELFKINSKYKDMFRDVGIDVVGGKMQVLDDAGKLLTDKSKKDGMDASQYIKKSVQLQSFFIELGEKKDFREDVAKAQYRAVMRGPGNWPQYLLNSAKDGLADSWTQDKIAMCAHLGHWLSSAGWSNLSYEDTKGDLLAIQYKFVTKIGKVVSKKFEGDAVVWPSSLTVQKKFSHYGSPKGDALTQFKAQWGETREIEIKETAKGSKKFKAYIKGTTKYITGVTLVHDSGDSYRIITPIGESDVEKYIKEDPAPTTPAPANGGK